MDERITKFLEEHHSGAMITVRANGTAHVARVTIGIVDGKVWSTGNADRVRTKHLRTNPSATYFVFDPKSRIWVGLEGKITIHDGEDAPQKVLTFRRAVGQAPDDVDAFLKEMKEVNRVVYELDVQRAYGAVLE
jgi:hypothetical protein